MSQSDAEVTAGDFAITMVYCINDLIKSAGVQAMTYLYPLTCYSCDTHDGYLWMEEVLPTPRWLTYERIANMMEGLILASVDHLAGYVYDGGFEASTPTSHPTWKVVTGGWTSHDASNRDNRTSVVPSETS